MAQTGSLLKPAREAKCLLHLYYLVQMLNKSQTYSNPKPVVDFFTQSQNGEVIKIDFFTQGQNGEVKKISFTQNNSISA